MNYEVELEHGREGKVFYREVGGTLEFWWEFMSYDVGYGVGIQVPSSSQWDAYCEKHSAAWAKGRRQEILERVALEASKQKASSAQVVIGDEWIEFRFS